MPELPEVETVRRSLERTLVGLRIRAATLHRRDIVTGPARRPDLLEGCVITALERHGKQLAIIGTRASKDRVLLVHLGMTGQLVHLAPRAAPGKSDHIHARWTLARGSAGDAGTLIFRDPRRFGGIWTLPSREALLERWADLGPDALFISSLGKAFHMEILDRLWSTSRPIKAALLDQRAIAGIGNIYADESLFAARISPHRAARTLTARERAALLTALRSTLETAIDARGSTLRDYVDGAGSPGRAQFAHAVYGRGGKPCALCSRTLRSAAVGQRTTVWCPSCQPGRASA